MRTIEFEVPYKPPRSRSDSEEKMRKRKVQDQANGPTFWQLTSLPGFSHARERSGWRSRLWLLVGTAGLLLTAAQVLLVISEYGQYPASTEVKDTNLIHYT